MTHWGLVLWGVSPSLLFLYSFRDIESCYNGPPGFCPVTTDTQK